MAGLRDLFSRNKSLDKVVADTLKKKVYNNKLYTSDPGKAQVNAAFNHDNIVFRPTSRTDPKDLTSAQLCATFHVDGEKHNNLIYITQDGNFRMSYQNTPREFKDLESIQHFITVQRTIDEKVKKDPLFQDISSAQAKAMVAQFNPPFIARPTSQHDPGNHNSPQFAITMVDKDKVINTLVGVNDKGQFYLFGDTQNRTFDSLASMEKSLISAEVREKADRTYDNVERFSSLSSQFENLSLGSHDQGKGFTIQSNRGIQVNIKTHPQQPHPNAPGQPQQQQDDEPKPPPRKFR